MAVALKCFRWSMTRLTIYLLEVADSCIMTNLLAIVTCYAISWTLATPSLMRSTSTTKTCLSIELSDQFFLVSLSLKGKNSVSCGENDVRALLLGSFFGPAYGDGCVQG